MSFESLFAEWKSTYGITAFIKDGIVDPSRYEKPHVLFVLRDMNCSRENDLRQDLQRDGSGWKTWNNIGRWTKALLDGCSEYPKDMSTSNRVDQLVRIAVMNLKKQGGTNRTPGDELKKAVEKQHDLISREISLCSPDIIICCGLPMTGCPSNADLLFRHVFSNHSDWEKFPSPNLPTSWWFYHAEIEGRSVPVISFCHPQATNLCGCRGHDGLFIPLYQDMLYIRERFLLGK